MVRCFPCPLVVREDIVRQTYCQVLNRPAESTGAVEHHANWLAVPGRTTKGLVRSFAHQGEFESRVTGLDCQAAVTILYDALLAREPDPGGMTTWCNVINTQGYRAAVDGIMNSAEYANRFGNDAVPNNGRPGCS